MNTTGMAQAQITEETFIRELLEEIPEFESIHKEEKEHHKIGINIVFGALARLTEKTTQRNDRQLLKRIATFIVRCNNEGKEDLQNALFVSFFETMNEETLKSISQYLPRNLDKKVQTFLRKLDESGL